MSETDSKLDLSSLVAELNSILEPNSNKDNEMAQTNYQLLKLYLDSIPAYDGNPHTLTIFIENCENLITNFASQTDGTLNTFLLRAILGKLNGRAQMLIGSRTELNTWQLVKDALNLSFGDQRDLDCLIQDLITLRPFKNETPYNFGMRCQETRSLVAQKLNTLNIKAPEKLIRIQSYDDLCLKTYIRGLPLSLQTNIRLRNPDSLEKAMCFVIEEENFLYSLQRGNNLNSQNSFRPSSRHTPMRNNNINQTFIPRNNFQQNRPNMRFPPYQYQNIRPQYQNNNFNPNNTFQPNQNHFRNFNNYNSNFNPRNFDNNNSNFRPRYFHNNNSNYQQRNVNNQPQNQNQYQPEPMDTNSRNTSLRSKPHFTSTQLFNQQINNDKIQFENPFENNNIPTDYEYPTQSSLPYSLPPYENNYETQSSPYQTQDNTNERSYHSPTQNVENVNFCMTQENYNPT
ncbi:putative mediator of RNA polymerase II transcription subunit 24 [Diabrotica virgifera virgifera]|uniref:GATA zinc finger domain-containing protein 14-like n=1 Tax=Diabrotica virgifera virgifera TaxID=50390 RepID=A0ABM5L1H8_DIAVI|nr:putative mediator of RNA polymerase II transcription subunit 24 [Diabrotica virgifera virgifera]